MTRSSHCFSMFVNIRADFRIHERSLSNRALWALVTYRFGNWALGRRLKPYRWCMSKLYGVLRIINEILTNITIYPGTEIGDGFHIIHGDGPITIHPSTVIGARCGIMHNVTIGTNMSEDVPVIGDDVFIGVGACILGGVSIGDRARIAANSLVIEDVPADSIAIGVPARIIPRLGMLGITKTTNDQET